MTEQPIQRMISLGRRAAERLASLGAYSLALMMVLTFLDVIGRYFFNAPILGTVEITELMMGLIIYTGIGVTTYARGHIQVDIIVGYLPPRVRAGLEVITLTITILFSLIIFWQLWLKAVDTFEANDLTQIWFLPVWPVAFTMAVCSLMLTMGMFALLSEAIAVLVKKEEA